MKITIELELLKPEFRIAIAKGDIIIDYTEFSMSEILEILSQDAEWTVRQAVAGNIQTSSNVLEILLSDEDEEVKLNAIKNPNMPHHVLETLSKNENLNVRIAVAKNSSTPGYVLDNLSNDENFNVRIAVAENFSTPGYVLDNLSNDEDLDVRITVAENSSTPENILDNLSNDEDLNVRIAVAKNSSTPGYVLDNLSNDDHESVLCYVVRNPNTSSHTLEKIFRSKYCSLKYNYSIYSLGNQCLSYAVTLNNAIFINSRTPKVITNSMTGLYHDIKRSMAKNSYFGVRLLAARLLCTTSDILMILSKDEDYYVKEELTKRTDLPKRALENLANDSDSYVKKALLENSSILSLDILKALSKDKELTIRRLAQRKIRMMDYLKT